MGADMLCLRCVNEMNEKMQERDETEGALPLLCACVCRKDLITILWESMSPTVFQNSHIWNNENLIPDKVKHPFRKRLHPLAMYMHSLQVNLNNNRLLFVFQGGVFASCVFMRVDYT